MAYVEHRGPVKARRHMVRVFFTLRDPASVPPGAPVTGRAANIDVWRVRNNASGTPGTADTVTRIIQNGVDTGGLGRTLVEHAAGTIPGRYRLKLAGVDLEVPGELLLVVIDTGFVGERDVDLFFDVIPDSEVR